MKFFRRSVAFLLVVLVVLASGLSSLSIVIAQNSPSEFNLRYEFYNDAAPGSSVDLVDNIVIVDIDADSIYQLCDSDFNGGWLFEIGNCANSSNIEIFVPEPNLQNGGQGYFSLGREENAAFPQDDPVSIANASLLTDENVDDTNEVVEEAVGNPDDPNTEEEVDESCEGNLGGFGWLVCPILRITGSAIGFIDQQVQNLLRVPEEFYNTEGVRNSWGNFRSLAYSLLAIIGLIMIISTALGFEFFSAYTIKRALPRFVIAVIFIALSFEITKLAVIIADDLGRGLIGFTTNAFTGEGADITLASLFDGSLEGDGGIFTGLLTGVGLAAGAAWIVNGGFWVLLGLAGAALLALLGVLVLLLFRQIFIVVLMVVAPLAILSWIFPGNDKLWGLWRTTFLSLLGLFPLVALMIGVGRGFAYTIDSAVTAGTSDSGSTGDIGTEILAAILKLIAYIAPYFFIPVAFKYAGGAFNNIAGMINNREKGLLDRSRAWGQRRSGREERKAEKQNLQKNTNTRDARDKVFNSYAIAKDSRGARTLRSLQGISPEVARAAKAQQSKEELSQAMYSLEAGGINNPAMSFRGENGRELDKDDALVAMASGEKIKNADGLEIADGSMAARRAASQTLARQGNVGRLREIQNYIAANKNESGKQAGEALSEAVQENVGAVMPKAPDLIKGNVGAFKEFKADEIVGWDASTVEVAIQHISNTDNFSGTAVEKQQKQEKAWATLGSALEQVAETPQLKARMGGSTVIEFKNQTTAALQNAPNNQTAQAVATSLQRYDGNQGTIN